VKHQIFIVGLCFGLLSCANYFLRKDCESVNWFDYGERLALAGKRVDEDSFVQKCRKADAELAESLLDKGFKKGRDAYCKPEGAFLTGKLGEYLQEELCLGLNVTLLKAEHTRGVREFCNLTNAYSVGSSGKEYNSICPKDLEAPFIREFNRGRKKFLAASIEAKEVDIRDSNQAIQTYLQRKSSIESELRMLMFLDFAPPNAHPEARKKREDLKSDSHNTNRQIDQEEARQRRLRDEIQQLRIRMESLDTSSSSAT
jgi:hypothetical protein